MAVRDDIREQRQSLKGQGVKAHLSYFWDYYKIPTLVVILVVAFVIYYIYSQVTAKDTVFTAYFVNAGDDLNQTASEDMKADFTELLSIDTNKEEVYIDTTRSVSVANSSAYDNMALSTVLSVAVQDGEMDCAVMDAYNFNSYAGYGTFTPLDEVLPQDVIDELEAEGKIFYVDAALYDGGEEVVTEEDMENEMSAEEAVAFEQMGTYTPPDKSTMTSPVAVGIDVTDSAVIEEHGLYEGVVCIFGFGANRDDFTNAIQFLEYLD